MRGSSALTEYAVWAMGNGVAWGAPLGLVVYLYGGGLTGLGLVLAAFTSLCAMLPWRVAWLGVVVSPYVLLLVLLLLPQHCGGVVSARSPSSAHCNGGNNGNKDEDCGDDTRPSPPPSCLT